MNPNSLLWNDLYKFTMMQAVYHNYRDSFATYKFIDRDNKLVWTEEMMQELRDAISIFYSTTFTTKEIAFLKSLPYFTDDFIEFLKFDFDLGNADVELSRNNNRLDLSISGSWVDAIWWEVPLLAKIHDIYYRHTGAIPSSDYLERARRKANYFASYGIDYIDFGTRRAFSPLVHDQVLEVMKTEDSKHYNHLLGTSNLALACKYGIDAVGTYAHEWVMANAGFHGVELANTMAMALWLKEFDGKLAVALTDTYTTEHFLAKSFSYDFANKFGVRQDSGDPFGAYRQYLYAYNTLDIDPADKIIIFSDGINYKNALTIHEYVNYNMRDIYGIGKGITNDVDAEDLNLVIKLVSVKKVDSPEIPVVKLSDTPGKVTGDPQAVLKVKDILEIL